MMDLQRKRLPEDVPTPVAVAVSDYCRRARAPASPGMVRDALALLEDSDDGRVRALADSEPTARLGPFAVVDVILGTQTSVAAEREKSGYYEEVRRATRRAPEKPVEVPVLTTSRPAAPRAQPPATPPRKPRASKQTLKEKIAPHKRREGEFDRKSPTQALPGTAFLPKRNLPAPRGRYTTVDPSRASFESLFRPDGKEIVSALIAQVPHRVALLRTLEQGYVSKKGQALSVGDVEDVLEAHELFELIEKKEREGVLAAVIDQKGSLGRAAHAFGLTADELEQLIGALDVTAQVEQVRERYSNEALAPDNLPLRLELLFRTRYLEDLGIERKFEQALGRDLGALIDEVKDAATGVATLVDLLSRQHALHAESLRRALEKLGLLEPWLKDKR